jgi:hypothetical protein
MSIGLQLIVNNNLRYYKLNTSRVLGKKFPSYAFYKKILLKNNQRNKHNELPLELSTLEMETLLYSKLLTFQEYRFKKLNL